MRDRPLCGICLILALLICITVYAGKGPAAKNLRPSPLKQTVPEDEVLILEGQVYQKEIKEKYQILFLKNNSINYQKQSFTEPKVIVYDKDKKEVHIGNEVRVTGTVSYYEGARNPGNFDQKLYYQKQGIHGNVWALQVEITDSEVYWILDRLYMLRQRWKSVLCETVGDKDGAILSAMILGDKTGMDADTKELYQANGIGHIIAISGLHLSFVGIGIYKILRRLTGSYPIGGMFGILFLALYILMIGFTVSAIRALTMFLFRVGADMTGRHYDAPTALSVSAVVVLLWRPLSLYDGGFWLSFGAVFAVLAVAPVVQKCKEREAMGKKAGTNLRGLVLQKLFFGIIHRSCTAVLQGIAASIGINMILFPIILYFFFEFPIYSFLLNLFVIPLMSVLLFMGMAGSLLSFAILPLSSICFGICRKILWLYKISCHLALALPGARFVAGKPKLWQIAVYYGILIIVLLLLREKERLMEHVDDVKNAESKRYKSFQKHVTRLGRFVLMIGVAGIIILTHRWGERGKLMTVVLDVGQGDSIFMRGPEGSTYLVDGGSSDVKKAGRYRIEPFLKSQGVGALDYVLISHGDSDHINGVEELMERQDIGVKIRTLVLPVQEVWDEALAGVAEKAKEYGIRVVVIEPGQNIKEGNMVITCIQPGNPGAEEGYETGNVASMVLAVKFGEFDMLLTGDVEGEGEEQLTEQLEEQYRDCTWEILKVAHHGSKNSSSEGFLRQVRPAYAFISAGRENRYGHPHQETIERLTDAGSKIHSTQENGAIIIEVRYGKVMKIEKY